MATFDPFEELELSRSASPEVAAAAYRRLARKYHPDSGESPNPARMVRINRAYQEVRERFGTSEPANNTGAHTSPIDDLISQAENAVSTHDWQSAEGLAIAALRLEPNNVRALQIRMEVAAERWQWPEVTRLATAALEIDPDSIESLLFAAEAAAADGDWILVRGLAGTVLRLSGTDEAAQEMWNEAQSALRARRRR